MSPKQSELLEKAQNFNNINNDDDNNNNEVKIIL
jgi:hypothetical protein